MTAISNASWAEIDMLRAHVASLSDSTTLDQAAQSFVGRVGRTYESVVLARLFIVIPYGKLPPDEQSAAAGLVGADTRLTAKTPVLSLLGTAGHLAEWNDRLASKGHRAIPLLDRSFVENIPMVAALLADLEVNLADLADGPRLPTRRLAGGINNTFYVPDASTARDAKGRLIIANEAFVKTHHIQTVFGMGGTWVDGTQAVAIFFCDAPIEKAIVDRFPSLISSFKMATTELIAAGRIYA